METHQVHDDNHERGGQRGRDQHHGHAHDHGHGDHGHSHTPEVTSKNVRAVGLAALLTGAFMIVEVAGGIVSGALALLADAGHMLTDLAALAMAWLAFRLAQRPADQHRTYGFDRISVLVAFVNGLSLFVIAGFIIWEAAQRFIQPEPVLGAAMLIVAVLGLVVNLIALKLLSGGDSGNLNIRAASLHVMGDLLGSVGAIAAAVIILTTGWYIADPILSVVVALIILKSAWAVTKASAHILLEGAPEGLDSHTIADDLIAHVPDLVAVDHVHAWSITQARPMVTLHGTVETGIPIGPICAAIRARLAERFDIDHATIEISSVAHPRTGAACDSGHRPAGA
ncbi:cation transporter [Pacificimonas sp. WHA3]|uniref:Cation transporter n=1 Tax=Pacificimonas pallii TaxID=2827236 RepID=A0ABS6SD13_9SPHN|nr:cation diffusion facilitator family transporter [Pacificimonas pallii]MBV7255796.1 cation transporter [Pacificimonas pallii]